MGVQEIAEEAAAVAQTAAALDAANIRAADMVRWMKTQMAEAEDIRINLFAMIAVERYLCGLMEKLSGVPAHEVAALARQSLIELAEVEE